MNDLVLQHSIGVDDKETAESDMLAGHVNAIRATSAAVFITGQGDLQPSHATLGERRGQPSFMRYDAIRADAQDRAIAFLELGDPAADRGQFRRSDQGEVTRVKEQDKPTVPKVRQSDPARRGTGFLGANQMEIRSPSANGCSLLSHGYLTKAKRNYNDAGRPWPAKPV